MTTTPLPDPNGATPVPAGAVKVPPLRAVTAPAAQPASLPLGAPERRFVVRDAHVTTPGPARMRSRHYLGIISFLLLVIAPVVLSAAYLWFVARDEYQSTASFSIRTEQAGGTAGGLLGAIASVGGSGAGDGDVLFDFIRSQEMVARVDERLDLTRIYHHGNADPYFSLGAEAAIEDKVRYWKRMVDVSYDRTSGILTVSGRAFAAADAQAVVGAVLDESGKLVNTLSTQARRDAIAAASADLTDAESHLRDMRGRMAEFRRVNHMIDPSVEMAGQTGVMHALQNQLAQSMVERDMLLTYADAKDQRVQQADRRITAIQRRIDDERNRLGVSDTTGTPPAEVIGQYEELKVDLEFANAAYTQALANVALARAESRRQARFLVAHVTPTLASQSEYPRRFLLTFMVALWALILWSIAYIIYYNVRDNR